MITLPKCEEERIEKNARRDLSSNILRRIFCARGITCESLPRVWRDNHLDAGKIPERNVRERVFIHSLKQLTMFNGCFLDDKVATRNCELIRLKKK